MAPLQPKDWDRDKVWDNIEIALRKKKRRRGFLLFYLGSGIFLLGLMVSVWLIPSSLPFKEEQKEVSSIRKMEDNPNLPTEDSVGIQLLEKANLSSSRMLEQLRGVVQEQEEITKKYTLITRLEKLTARTSILPLRSLRNPVVNEMPNPPDLLTILAINDHYSMAQKNAISTSTQEFVGALPFIESLSLNFLEKPDDVLLFPRMHPIPDHPSPIFFCLSTFLGTGNAKYEGPEDWRQAKANSESFEYGASSTIGIDWYFSPRWYAYSGVTYQLIRNQYEFTSSQSTVQLIESDSAIVYSITSEPYYEPGFLQETRTTKRSIVHNNALHRFSIPLGIGFMQPINQFQLEARIGIRFQVFQRFDGIALDETTNQHLLDNDLINERYYHNNPSLDFTTSLLLNYPVNAKNYLFFGVQYERSGLIHLGSSPYQTDYRLWGAQVGWKFNW